MKIKDRIKSLVRVRACDLLPNPKNWRTHPTKQADALRGVLSEVGWADAVLARETEHGLMLIDGHLRAEVAPEAEVPVLVLDVTEDEADKILLTHDPLTGMANTDSDKLDSLMRTVQTGNEALAEMITDLSGLLDNSSRSDVVEDQSPEPPEEPVTKQGDVWQLGGHRLTCGDSREVLDKLGPQPMFSAVITDPPYGVDYVGGTKSKLPVHNDEPKKLKQLLEQVFSLSIQLTYPGGIWYVTAGDKQFYTFATVLREHDIWKQTLVWVKQSLVLGRGDYHYQHESIFYGWRPGAKHKEPPDRKQTTIWHFDRPTASREHPTMKPVALFAKMIENSTVVGTDILDPFGGSGTTLIAAEQLGRQCFTCEISPNYCDVIVERWQNLTGGKAKREGSTNGKRKKAKADAPENNGRQRKKGSAARQSERATAK